MKHEFLKVNNAGAEFYHRGMSYHNYIDSVRTNARRRGVQKVGTIFVFDTHQGFDSVIEQFANVVYMNVGKTYAPEIRKPALLVLTQAEFKRRQCKEV